MKTYRKKRGAYAHLSTMKRCKVIVATEKQIETGRTLYGNIGVKRTASNDKIRRGVRRAFKKLHPDKTNFDGETKTELGWNCIERTRDILCDDIKKKNYDKVINELPPHGGSYIDFNLLQTQIDKLSKEKIK
jgi:curved DNA-binding protein CbpA